MIPYELPPKWFWASMGEIADVVGGGTPPTGDPLNFECGSIPWITPADLSGYSNKFIERGSRSITSRGLATSSARMLPPGTVLFSSRAPIGYVAIAAKALCTNQGFRSFVITNKEVLPDYVYWWLKGNKQLAESYASGTTFLELSGTKAKQLPIPIAPPGQQARIVSEIEKQFSRLDEAVAGLKRAQTSLKRYKAAVLKAAVEGKLTEEWCKEHPDVEPASEVLTRILAERRAKWEEAELSKMKAQGKMPKDDKWKLKYQQPAKPDPLGLPALPRGWTWVTCEQVCDFITKGTTPSAEKLHNGNGEIRFLKVYNLTFTGERDSHCKPAFVDRLVHDRELARSKVCAGDVLANIVGPPLGQVSIVPSEIFEANINQAIARFRPVDGILGRFLMYELLTDSIMSWAIRKAKTTAGQSNLTLQLCRELPIPLPPASEQNQIVTEIERLASVVEELSAEVESNLKRAQALRQSILKQAFEGKLTGCILRVSGSGD
jgi:type I restriction enzyme S subunit